MHTSMMKYNTIQLQLRLHTFVLKKRAKVSLTYPSHLPVAALLISASPLPVNAVPESQCEYAQHLLKNRHTSIIRN